MYRMLKKLLKSYFVRSLFLLIIFFQQSHCMNNTQLQIYDPDVVGTSFLRYADGITKCCIDEAITSERMFYTYGKAPIFIIIGGSCAGKSFVSRKVSELLSSSKTGISFKSFLPDKMLRDSGLAEISEKIGVRGAIVDFFPQGIAEAIEWCISNGDFKRVVRSNLMSRFPSDEAIRIFEAFTEYLTDDFEAASVADIAIAYSSRGIGTFVDHIHKYSDLVLLKRMLELKLFRAEIIPFFIPNSFQELMKRSALRNIEAAKGSADPCELRFSSRACREFFRNITASPKLSLPLYEIDKTSFLAIIETLKTTYFPVLIDELKTYVAGTEIMLDVETERIYRESITAIETFFGVDQKKIVYFNGGDEVLIMSADEIVHFVGKYYGL